VKKSVLIAAAMLAAAMPVYAQQPDSRVELRLEGLNIRQDRNDVRVPSETGTPFSIVDLVGPATTPSVRAELTVGLTERQQLRFVYAPVVLNGTGTPSAPIDFADETFAPVATDAEYKFSSYRVTWRYRVYDGERWTWRVGATAFVRDARIALEQPGRAAEDTNIGFVPLGHLSGDVRLSQRWSLGMELDGVAAPQGRAIDFSAVVNYSPVPRVTLSGGYRTIEGGADVESVYAFGWLNAAIARVSVRF
jgi:hypothetical protein